MLSRLAEEVKIVQAITITAGAAGTTGINGSAIDMSGDEGCMIVGQLGTIVAGAVTSLKVQQATDSAFTSPDDLAGTGQTILDTDDDTVKYVDVKRPLKDFLRIVISR